MITDHARNEENTGIQERAPYGERFDIQPDFVMVYGIDATLPDRIKGYQDRGYITHLMTGVSWGDYLEYLNGSSDGRNHWDEAQMDRDGNYVLHGPDVPYMIPSVSFASFLIERIKPAIDAGVNTIHLEEPEIWSWSGYSDAMKREYKLYYHENWVAPHTSPDAYFRNAKLKNYLYTRTLSTIASALKEYAMTKYKRELRFIVPTHSLINYIQYGIVSPESSLLDQIPIDGYIAQIWTGTSRMRNVYHGVRAERVFECSFLEYGIMQELVRGTDRAMWLLQDPIEDDPNRTWDYYRRSYLEGLTAALLQPKMHRYEICPWPQRVWTGKYPRNANGITISQEYETVLLSTTQTLRDMDQPYQWLGNDGSIGILIADSSMYQRNHENGVTLKDKQYDPKGQENNFSSFFGLSLPLLKQGIPVLPVQLDNVRRQAGYLDEFRLLVLSYEFMKPEYPDLHYALAGWVRNGGSLVIVASETDDFHGIRHWWTRAGYQTPTEHLLETLGLERQAAEGSYPVECGLITLLRENPAALAYSAESADRYAVKINRLMEKQHIPFEQKNYFALRRGPYVVAHVMEDSTCEPFTLDGVFADLYDPHLRILHGIRLNPGENILAADLSLYRDKICLVGSAGRVENFTASEEGASMIVKAPEGARCALRFICPEPKEVVLDEGTSNYDKSSGTLLIEFAGHVSGVPIRIFV